MKQLIAFLAALALLMTCACGRAENAETTEPATDPVTTAAPTTAAPVTKAPEPETVISYAFQLEELPEIGAYEKKSPVCFYDAPLSEFRPSDRYGAVIPYLLSSDSVEFFTMERYGLMTVDGRLITGPIYDSIGQLTVDGAPFYIARRKLFEASPERFDNSNYDEMSDEERKTFFRRRDAVIDHAQNDREIQLISADGSRYGAVTGDSLTLYTDACSGVTLFTVGRFSEFTRGLVDNFRIYDTELNLLADFTDWLEEYPEGMELIGADGTGYALFASHGKNEDTGEIGDVVLFFEGTTLTKKVWLADHNPTGIFGDWIITKDGLFDFEGNEIVPGKLYSDILYVQESNCCVAADAEAGELVCFFCDGSRQSVDVLSSGNHMELYLRRSGGREYIILEHGKGYWGDGLWKYSVYDSSLRPVFTLPYDSNVELSYSWDRIDSCDAVIVVRHEDKTEIRSLEGDILAELPFYADSPFFDTSAFIFLKEKNGEKAFLFSMRDHSLKELIAEADSTIWYVDGNVVECRCRDGGNRSYSKIISVSNDRFPFDHVSDFLGVTLNGKTYYAFTRNNTGYVCDETMRMIAEIPDDYYA